MSELYQTLNKKQQEAVENLLGPVLVVAGAGSGKTRTLTSRLAAILASGADPESVIAITFTNKAAEEMRKRVFGCSVGSRRPLASPFIGTFHSLGARILKKEARLVGRTQNFSIFDDDDSLRLIKAVIKNFNLPEQKKQKETNPLFLREEFSRIKSELSNPDDEDETINRFFKEYETALRRNNSFDFDDLIEKPVRIFENHRDILKNYQKKFRHILVDEFQDTNTAQYIFLKLIAQGHRNLSVVGDDAQSIYAFRYSDFRIFLNFERDWPETKIVFLEQNYRSTGNIIRAASSLISNNKFQKQKNLWTENKDGALVKIVEHRKENEEADWVAEQIQNSIRREADKNKNYNIAVLYRTNAQSRAIESALIERSIAYKIFGGVKFYERKEIKDIVAVLRWAFNPDDSVSFERIKSAFLKEPFLEIKKIIPEASKKLAPAELISFILEITDYFGRLKKHYDNFRERIENINELVYYASEFENQRDFLEKISLFQSGDMAKKNNSATNETIAVNLMTIHLAKGLEFDTVFIVGCNEGLLPHQMSYGSDEEIEEERRLMYVAMTRAKKELCLNFYNLPSRFIYEIAPETTEFISEKNESELLSDFLDDQEHYIEY
jgi:DNA helicase-2/ATP-dependent DNA helicase PcrA